MQTSSQPTGKQVLGDICSLTIGALTLNTVHTAPYCVTASGLYICSCANCFMHVYRSIPHIPAKVNSKRLCAKFQFKLPLIRALYVHPVRCINRVMRTCTEVTCIITFTIHITYITVDAINVHHAAVEKLYAAYPKFYPIT